MRWVNQNGMNKEAGDCTKYGYLKARREWEFWRVPRVLHLAVTNNAEALPNMY